MPRQSVIQSVSQSRARLVSPIYVRKWHSTQPRCSCWMEIGPHLVSRRLSGHACLPMPMPTHHMHHAEWKRREKRQKLDGPRFQAVATVQRRGVHQGQPTGWLPTGAESGGSVGTADQLTVCFSLFRPQRKHRETGINGSRFYGLLHMQSRLDSGPPCYAVLRSATTVRRSLVGRP